VDRRLAMALLARAVVLQGGLTTDNMRQLHSLVLLLQPTSAEIAATFQQQPGLQQLVAQCRAAHVEGAKDSAASGRQWEVLDVLRSIGGLRPELEHSAEGGLFCIDIALDPGAGPGRRVAVEVDGPTHFTRSQPYRKLGRTVLRKRLLEQAGWRVVSVPVHVWDGLKDRAGYLKRLLGL
jgi:hypothetical protein